MTQYKYLISREENYEEAYVYNLVGGAIHSDYSKERGLNSVRGGYMEIDKEGNIHCFGRSTSLDLECDPEIDQYLIALKMRLNEKQEENLENQSITMDEWETELMRKYYERQNMTR